MTLSLYLPAANARMERYTLTGHAPARAARGVKFNRIAYSAAHVVADPLAAVDPWLQRAVDWDATIAYRRHLCDFDYPELIERGSDALLGIFDAIAPAASAALGELARGNADGFHAILGPTVPLSRHIFRAPTRFYKTGIVFMAWLNGPQSHFTMVGGQQSARSLAHFAELFRLADRANLLEKPELAVARMRTLLALHGIESQ